MNTTLLLLLIAGTLRAAAAVVRPARPAVWRSAASWLLALAATWIAVTAAGLWTPFWPVLLLAIGLTAAGQLARLPLIWPLGNFVSALILIAVSLFPAEPLLAVGLAAGAAIAGLALDGLVARLPRRLRPALPALGLIATVLAIAVVREGAISSLALLWNRGWSSPAAVLHAAEPGAAVAPATLEEPEPAAATLTPNGDTPLTPPAAATSRPDDRVGRWEVYELALRSSKRYANPFVDVDVYAEFVAPGGRVSRVYGFHDGDGRGGQGDAWKIRFMPDEIGAWSWRTTATDATNGGLHDQSGQFTVVESDQPGPIRPDPGYPGAWRHANGDYFFWNLGYAIHLAGADRTHPIVGGWQDYLDWLEAHRFNGVMFLLQVASFDACSTCQKGMARWRSLDGHEPPTYAFNNNGRVDYFVMPWARIDDPDAFASSSADADFSRFFLPYWQNVDAIVAEMQARNMLAHVWLYDDETFWPAASSDEEHLYWDYAIRRLGAYWNVAFNDGIDLGEYRPIPTWVNEWQQYFARRDPFGHPRSSRHGSDQPQVATWRSVQAADERRGNLEAWRALMATAPLKPVTEDDGIRAGKDDGISPERFMRLAWWSLLSGPGGVGATWAGLYDPGNWFSNLDQDSEGMRLVEHRNRFVLDFDPQNGRQIPFWKLAPADALLSGAGVHAAAAAPEHYLVFFDAGAAPAATLDLQGSAAALPITWLNPLTGERMAGGEAPAGAILELANPFDGPAVVYVGYGEP